MALLAIGGLAVAPTLIRADVASDEAQALADVRAVSRAEEAYAAANFGFYSDVVNLCRSGPECNGIGIPGYPASAPEFIVPELGRTSPYVKDNYSHTWTSGPPPYQMPPLADPGSAKDYCYTVSPWFLEPAWPSAYGVNGTGQVFVDPTGAEIACPIPTREVYAAARPALAVDFGKKGLWRYDGDGAWLRLARSNATLVRAWNDQLLASFKGKNGLYLLDDAGWRRIHPRRADDVVLMPVGLVARLRNLPGLWYWDETDWSQISPWEPEAIDAQGNRLLVDFGAEGLWYYWRPFGWLELTDTNPDYIRADALHLWADVGGGVQWVWVPDLNVPYIWFYGDHGAPPESRLEFPGRYWSSVAEDRGLAGGIVLNRAQVSTWDPYVLSHLERDLVAAFRGRGLYRYENNTTWVELSASEPSELAATDTYLGAVLDDTPGVHRFDDSGTQPLTTWKAESLTPVDLAMASQSLASVKARRCPVPKKDRGPETCLRLVRRSGWP